MKSVDITGQRYGMLTPLGLAGRSPNGRVRLWLCLCDCGERVTVHQHAITSGHTRSCGCWRRERSAQIKTIHGMTRAPEFNVWALMRKRCQNPQDDAFKDYGGRGIRVCDRWDSFQAFYDDVGPRPGPKYQLDRVNNNGNYEPGNVEWATHEQQQNNKRNNVFLTHEGQTLTLSQWCRIKPIQAGTLSFRVRSGWTAMDALTTPVATKHRRRSRADAT